MFPILQQNPITSTIWMFALIFIVFYFFMIRPQLRKQKIEKKFQENLKKGIYIVTNSGLHGRIIDISNHFCILETITGKIKFEKNAISKELTQLRYENFSNNKKKEIELKKNTEKK
ncbi:preprotein translocase subunit YajC [Blattabacterium sp. (Cryptocercus kyebangensis)]|uniref:preprotein translocase subunit YajC n=1 Tax=Blattabacterium sp. (Cryptocercus kyebangensis) TaxID=298656 RepID=UPI000D7C81B1|nr:preprotein translocase subunit YajC [Blattabacterium sp. (Cryptocercus kyebangensis)]AWU43641.1 preprotein translocase subunit YajC [Blattabacterium sp. (Cryptocercus kyebangensis)]